MKYIKDQREILVTPNATQAGSYVVYVTIIDSKFSIRSYPLIINITTTSNSSNSDNNNMPSLPGSNTTIGNWTQNETDQVNDTWNLNATTNVSSNIFSNILGAYI
jgi:hypothetical protein